MPQITIISESVTNRLDYVCNVLFKHILKWEYKIQLLSDKTSITGIVVNYSQNQIKDSIQIIPSGLLDESSVRELKITIGEFEGLKTLFHSDYGNIPFDIFSASFYLLSRYEEYLPFEPDLHGRFSAKQSITFKNGFHNMPIVELWAKLLAKQLKIEYPLEKTEPIITIDIDYAWRYKNRGFFYKTGGLLKSLLLFNFKDVQTRLKVFLNKVEDPFYTYDYLSAISELHNAKLYFFLLMGKNSKEDTGFSDKNKAFQKLIQSLNARHNIGIHPSYASFSEPALFKQEYEKLQNIVGRPIENNRQHYLLLKFPETYKKLLESNVEQDFSMGWHDLPGFRAGISRPFPYYNLETEGTTNLTIHPFATMDRTLSDYLGLKPEQALEEIIKLKQHVDSVGGQFSMIWHNDSVSEFGEWKGWRKVFEASIQ